MPVSQGTRWCFTINNWTNAELDFLTSNAPPHENPLFSYLVVGREVGENGTPHLQGFCILTRRRRLTTLRTVPGLGRAHLELSRARDPSTAAAYCKKDGNFDEFGTIPVSGVGQQWADFREWVKTHPTTPTIRDVWDSFPSLAARNSRAVRECISIYGKRPNIVDGELREWQHSLDQTINEDPNSRDVRFVIDEVGNTGKTWLLQYWMSNRDDVQFLSVGKRDDLAYAIDTSKRLFVFDVPRGCIEHFQYSIVEMLKNRMIFSNKYESCAKIIPHNVHVVVFTNEHPDMTKLSRDRYKITNLRSI